MNALMRLKAPTPRFFRKLRAIGLLLTAVSGALLGRALPAAVLKAAEHLGTAGIVLAAVSQATVDEEALRRRQKAAP